MSIEAEKLFAEVSLGAPENAVGFVLWRLVHRYQREADRALAPLDLTQLQFMTLTMAAWLGRSGEPVAQATLAEHGDIQPMQLSHMLKALEAKGFVRRTTNPADVRAKCLTVTAAGLAVLREALPLVIDVQRRLFGDQGLPGGDLLEALVALDGAVRTRT
ncbi:MarR family winged helix-turn-helix transcriptional regulator [Kutzneria sp. NPDC052558]|uniref:MarR family winged helix-turn-helix transcriptional regulator n=1 Tax=Kutzneria sp. NPDC052558 TaxID=3364121 RepID=UPI0037CCA0B5